VIEKILTQLGAGSAAATQRAGTRGGAGLKPPGPRRPSEESCTRVRCQRSQGGAARHVSSMPTNQGLTLISMPKEDRRQNVGSPLNQAKATAQASVPPVPGSPNRLWITGHEAPRPRGCLKLLCACAAAGGSAGRVRRSDSRRLLGDARCMALSMRQLHDAGSTP
jgi:hypothetical protein